MNRKKILLSVVVLVLWCPAFAGMQEDRLGFMQKMTAMHIIEHTAESNNVVKVKVGKAFYVLDYNAKNKFCNVVYAYYHTKNANVDLMRIIDNYTGKDIGVYAEMYGGLKLN